MFQPTFRVRFFSELSDYALDCECGYMTADNEEEALRRYIDKWFGGNVPKFIRKASVLKMHPLIRQTPLVVTF